MSPNPTPKPSAAPSAISVRNLRVKYGEREILHGISFEVPAGETLVILGGSGSGKGGASGLTDAGNGRLRKPRPQLPLGTPE